MSLKLKLKNKEFTVGSWITIGSTDVAELLGKTSLFDWLVVDMEHSAIGIREAQEIIRVIDLCGVAPIVRLTENNEGQIKRVMDAGAHGIMVPMVNSKADAELAVSSVYYPPKGSRGSGLTRAQGYGSSFAEYKTWLYNEAVIVVMIEHVKSIQSMDEIVGVEGIDAFIVGPYDLSASIGEPGNFKSPEFSKIMNNITNRLESLKIPGGIHVVDPDIELFTQYKESGFTFMGYGMDTRFIDTISREHLSRIRKNL